MRVRFDDFAFDTDTRQLLRAGQPQHLSPRAFALLAALLESRPRAVSADELRARVWPDTHVAGNNLHRVINEVRAALGDRARQPRYVRTVHGHGYAFVSVCESEPGAGVAGSAGVVCWIERGDRMLSLEEGVHVLGRDPAVAIPIATLRASRRHARIHVRSDGADLEDLGSKNGTLLEGQRVEGRVPLPDGAEIRIGGIALVFRMAAAGESTESATRR